MYRLNDLVYFYSGVMLEFSSLKGTDVINISPDLITRLYLWIYSDTYGNIEHEVEFYFSSVSTLSEFGGDVDHNITNKFDHLFDSYPTSTDMSSSTLSLYFLDCRPLHFISSIFTEWMYLSLPLDDSLINCTGTNDANPSRLNLSSPRVYTDLVRGGIPCSLDYNSDFDDLCFLIS